MSTNRLSWLRFHWIVVFVLAIGLLAGSVGTSKAAVIIEDGGHIAKDQVIEDDVFISGENVVIDGTVKGILFAAGKTVTLNGTIEGDAFLSGEEVVVSETAKINGNLAIGARSFKIDGKVTGSTFGGSADGLIGAAASIGRNLYYGGYNLETKPGSTITKDLFVGGAQVLLGGEVQRDAHLAASSLDINNKIGGDATMKVGQPGEGGFPLSQFYRYPGMPQERPSGLRISNNAIIGGKLIYTSKADQGDAIQAKPQGGIVYQTPVPDEQKEAYKRAADQEAAPIAAITPVAAFGGWVLDILRNLITLLLLGGLALWLLPVIFKKVVDQARAKPLPAAGFGLVSILVAYLGSVLVGVVIFLVGLLVTFITFGGLSFYIFALGLGSLSVVMLVFTILVVFGSKLVVAYWGGDLLVQHFMPDVKHMQIWAMVVGVVIYTILAAIPFLGWLVALAATLVGVGGMWYYVRLQRVVQAPAA